MVTAIGKGEGEVDIVAWAGYIERGATDKAYDWVDRLREGHRLQG
jgi:putative spermidine/putrescine transport system substrate-binding protein